MTVNITPIINAVLALIAALITAFVIPWIKSKTTAQQREKMMTIVRLAVEAAEQLFDKDAGEAKKQYVVRYLAEQGYEIDESLNNTIEALVLELHRAIADA